MLPLAIEWRRLRVRWGRYVFHVGCWFLLGSISSTEFGGSTENRNYRKETLN